MGGTIGDWRAERFTQIVNIALCLPVGNAETLRKTHGIGVGVLRDHFVQPLDTDICCHDCTSSDASVRSASAPMSVSGRRARLREKVMRRASV